MLSENEDATTADLEAAFLSDVWWQIWFSLDDEVDWATLDVYQKITLLHKHVREELLVLRFMAQFTDWADWDWQKQHAFLRLTIPECAIGLLSGPETSLEHKLATIHGVAQEWGKQWDEELGKLSSEDISELYNGLAIELI